MGIRFWLVYVGCFLIIVDIMVWMVVLMLLLLIVLESFLFDKFILDLGKLGGNLIF